MSEHEGYCVPLLEAMFHNVPIMAYRAAAVPDTLGPAGVLVTKKDESVLGELAELVLSDTELRRTIVRGQKRRLAEFEPAHIARRFRGYIQELLAA
jgi:glycosyltransferase involved in cell wall biosynthesis